MQSLKSNKILLMKQITLITFLVFCSCAIKAQISTGEIPYSWERGSGEVIMRSIPEIVLSHLDMKTIGNV